MARSDASLPITSKAFESSERLVSREDMNIFCVRLVGGTHVELLSSRCDCDAVELGEAASVPKGALCNCGTRTEPGALDEDGEDGKGFVQDTVGALV